MARCRDGSGQVVEVATNCKDEVAARAVLTQLERRSELVRAGVLTPAEDNAADHAGLPLSRHLDAYEKHLYAKGCDPRRISMLRRRLERLARDCRFSRLNKMSAGPVERWLVERADVGMAASTRNSYREAAVCFGTHLCAAGVPLRTAQAAMRHSKPELTANVYIDPKLLDVAGAIDALPALVLPPEAATSATAAGQAADPAAGPSPDLLNRTPRTTAEMAPWGVLRRPGAGQAF